VPREAFPGSIAFFGHWSRLLTLHEMAEIMRGNVPLGRANLIYNIGERGAGRTVLNYAPLATPPHATITGAKDKGHALGVPFRPMVRRVGHPAAAAGGGTGWGPLLGQARDRRVAA
jgi:hypothetical protein